MQAWEAWSIEALMLNITLCTLFSIFSKMDEQQKNFATICMADNVYIPIRVELKQKSIAEMKQQLFLVLGQEADTEIQSALSSLKFDTNELRPGALRKIRDTINASLNMRFGVLAADKYNEPSTAAAFALWHPSKKIFSCLNPCWPFTAIS